MRSTEKSGRSDASWGSGGLDHHSDRSRCRPGGKQRSDRIASVCRGKQRGLGVLEDLRKRKVARIDLIVTDGHEGLLAAVNALFAATPRQRCLLHKQRNVLNAIPRRVRKAR